MLSWTNLNQIVKFVNVKKKFYNRYLYKIVVYAPAGKIIIDNLNESVESSLNKRIAFLKNFKSYNYAGSWVRGSYKDKQIMESSDKAQLEYYRDVVQQYKGRIKLRVEEPNVSIYSEDESDLFKIASGDPCNDRIIEVHRPENDKAIEILNKGQIIVRSESEYKYKVYLRAGKIQSIDVRDQIFNYLSNLGEEVSMTKGCYANLKEREYWFVDTYFYCKDDSIITFLKLIAPECVSGIFKLAVVDN